MINERAVIRLGGNVGVIKGPTTSVGIILMKSMLFSLAASHAAFSAKFFETKYICRERERRKTRVSIVCLSFNLTNSG